MVGRDRIVAEPFTQMPRHALGHLPRIDEDQRGSMASDQFGQPVVVLGPHLVRGDGLECRPRHLDTEIHRPPVTFVDDAALACVARRQVVSDLFDRALGGG